MDKILIAAARMVIINASGNNYLSSTRCHRAPGTKMADGRITHVQVQVLASQPPARANPRQKG